MDTLLLTPGGLLITVVVLAMLIASVRGIQRPTPMVVYVPVETQPEPNTLGCLPLVLIVGILLVIVLGII